MFVYKNHLGLFKYYARFQKRFEDSPNNSITGCLSGISGGVRVVLGLFRDSWGFFKLSWDLRGVTGGFREFEEPSESQRPSRGFQCIPGDVRGILRSLTWFQGGSSGFQRRFERILEAFLL